MVVLPKLEAPPKVHREFIAEGSSDLEIVSYHTLF